MTDIGIEAAAEHAAVVVDRAVGSASVVVDRAAESAVDVVDRAASRAVGIVQRAANEAALVVERAAEKAAGKAAETVENTAELAAEKAIDKFFVRLGINTEDPISMQKDFAHLRAWRESVESVKKQGRATAVSVIVTAALGALWLGIKGWPG